jgi:hypothetical protein
MSGLKGIVVSLCDLTGIMVEPWAEAGYTCFIFDAQHPKGFTVDKDRPNIIKVGGWLTSTADVWEQIKKDEVKIVFGFPECTHLAVSGAAHFARKREKDPLFQEKAMELVYLCRDVGEESGAPYFLENPVSVISTKWRKPNYIFSPYEYGGYLPEDDVHPVYPDKFPPRDAYPKKTCLWTGNGFIMPEKKPVGDVLDSTSFNNRCGGRSVRTKNIRSATPRGFALAVYEANK